MDVPFTSDGFEAPLLHLNGTGALRVTMADLVRSALLCGHLPPGNFWPFAGYRGHSAIWRASITRAHLAADPVTNRCVPTTDYRLLEATERGFVTWLLGSSVTHLVAQRMVGLPVLLHLTTYGAAFNVTMPGKLRPDFIAPMQGGQWAVFEAKGRSRLGDAVMAHAKDQARAVKTICGVTPAIHAVCVSVFRETGLEVKLRDPPPEPVALNANTAAVIAEYYRTVTDLLEMGSEADQLDVGGRAFRVANLEALDVVIGLSAEVEAVLATDDGGVRMGLAHPDESFDPGPQAGTSVGPDGVLVILGDSWRGLATPRSS